MQGRSAMAVDDPDMSSSAPTEDEVKSALKKLKNSKKKRPL